jgi:hypothetical protein
MNRTSAMIHRYRCAPAFNELNARRLELDGIINVSVGILIEKCLVKQLIIVLKQIADKKKSGENTFS